ncbi:MAG: UDP-3-O-(3-hydroxymyristoyl)glucosamine N-acyltransferase [Neisseriaceae bacterium]|nr:UDP-3-O-(3-hydroxymyristoyl)glucosamine N-acyltransferase [Neisseriaceae bacterium]
MQKYTLSEIVHHLGGKLVGNDKTITSVKSLEDANDEQITFLSNPKYRSKINETNAGAIIVKDGTQQGLPENKSYLLCDDPYLYFAKVMRLFNPMPKTIGQIHPSAVIHPSAKVPESCEISANVVICADVSLGENCRILAGSVIGTACVLDDDCVIYPNTVLYPKTVLGKRVVIHACCTIGADGFGNARDMKTLEWHKIPQVGGVVIGSDSEIGAHTTIDRGTLSDTVVGEGCRIDNQVQIGHNCKIGKHTAIAACAGISGSVNIGDYCIIGGAAMFVGHIEIADGTIIGGGTAVTRSIKEAGYYATCFPLQTKKDWSKNAVHIRHLDDIYHRLKVLEKKLSQSS